MQSYRKKKHNGNFSELHTVTTTNTSFTVSHLLLYFIHCKSVICLELVKNKMPETSTTSFDTMCKYELFPNVLSLQALAFLLSNGKLFDRIDRNRGDS